MEQNKTSKAKLIAAAITLLLGIILAIGYPAGGVKANKIANKTQKITERETRQSKTENPAVKNEKSKKKRIVPIAPPPGAEESQDEGC